MNCSLKRDVDVAVVGGGPGGAATALQLVRGGVSVALIEQSAYGNIRVGETLPPEIRTTLRGLGIWDQFLREAHNPSSGVRYAWGQPDISESDFIFNPYGVGWHIDRSRFDAMLAHRAEQAGVCVYTSAKCRADWEGIRGGWEVSCASADKQFLFRTRFLVDATGRRSVVARKRGALRISFDRLVGIVVLLRGTVANSPDDCTLVEAVEDGWWYSASVPGSRHVVAYMTDADLFVRGSDGADRFWRQQLQKTIHTRALIDSYPREFGPFIVAANSSRLNRFSDGNWLAVGDAAFAFDPLSSQGVYRALESGIRAAQVVRSYFGGARTALRSYSGEMEESFDHYLLLRNKYYGLERRWPQSIFWRRRWAGRQ
jgi:flavin-dependent dehydrogenase